MSPVLDLARKGDAESTSTFGQDSSVLDLSTRKKEDTNNNNIKKEEKSSVDQNALFLRKLWMNAAVAQA